MLSPSQFAELIALIQTIRDDGSRSEVRRAPRIEHPCRISITLGREPVSGDGILVQMRDISARGLAFLHNQAIPSGTVFRVKLEPPVGNAISVAAHVVHCRQVDGHTFQIGAEFECAPNPEPLDIERSAEDLMQQVRPPARSAIGSSW
jgi:hypothetical protein